MSETLSNQQPFDVFLCHNGKDKAEIRPIARALAKAGVRVWFDEWELLPGVKWQEVLQNQIESIKSAAVFIGSHGLGPWQDLEVESFLAQFVERKCPIVPVILNTATQSPKLPVFLRSFQTVDFRISGPEPLGRVCKLPQNLKPKDKLDMQKRVILKPSLEKALPKLASIIETIERKIPY